MATSLIKFLDCPSTISVETPISLTVSWGDRVSRNADGPVVYGSLCGDLCVSAGQLGHWRDRCDITVRGTIDGYAADLTDEQCSAALETYRLVAATWRSAVETDPDIASAVEGYRKILDRIEREHDAHYARWDSDASAIARKFRRRAVVVGEQTVPGKCCVRSTRGNLLGYAHIWDGRWLGTIERI